MASTTLYCASEVLTSMLEYEMARVVITGGGIDWDAAASTPEELANMHDWSRKEHEFMCRLADNNPWRWPTAESIAEADIERHTCPECGSYVEDGDW